MSNIASKLDWNQMLGFEQVADKRLTIKDQDARLGAKIGDKRGDKGGGPALPASN